MAETKVTRIKAKTPVKGSPKSSNKKARKSKVKKDRQAPKNPILRGLWGIGEYFKGAWYELRQVRWPTRGATWSLTLAVLLFTAFFTVIILLLDLLFNYLFELIIG